MRHLLAFAPLFLLAAACGSSSATPSGSGGSGGGATTADDAPTLVMTDKGPVQGTVAGASRIFYAIPYAAPPVGDLRWKPPAPHATWTTPVSAAQPGPACGQLDALTSMSFDTTTSEDCLTVNVWAPKAKTAQPAPVMVWIHGGSFVIGSGGSPDYDGQALAEATGAVVVTINYRLGPMGFLALGALHDEDPAHPSSGMYGIEDQRAALAWTRDNIAAFGGDPKNVTIFGESAGGISVCTHLVSPPSQGLFHRAIIESGACTTGLATTETTAETQGDALVKALGCDGKSPADTLTCIRGKKVDEVLTAMPVSAFNIILGGVSWGTVVDGLNLTDNPVKLFTGGSFAKVPTLLGTNTNEGAIFFAFSNPVTDDATYETLADALVPGHGADIVAHYPSATYGTPKDAAAAAITDAGFTCPARRMARAVTAAGVPTFRYHFAHTPTNSLVGNLGSFHSAEIPFVFGHASQLEPNTPTDAEAPLSKAMQGYWGRMATAGDPNGDGAVSWPKYDATTEPDLVLDLTVSTETAFKKADCDFWDGLVAM